MVLCFLNRMTNVWNLFFKQKKSHFFLSADRCLGYPIMFDKGNKGNASGHYHFMLRATPSHSDPFSLNKNPLRATPTHFYCLKTHSNQFLFLIKPLYIVYIIVTSGILKTTLIRGVGRSLVPCICFYNVTDKKCLCCNRFWR